jgi:hypothetical protein
MVQASKPWVRLSPDSWTMVLMYQGAVTCLFDMLSPRSRGSLFHFAAVFEDAVRIRPQQTVEIVCKKEGHLLRRFLPFVHHPAVGDAFLKLMGVDDPKLKLADGLIACHFLPRLYKRLQDAEGIDRLTVQSSSLTISFSSGRQHWRSTRPVCREICSHLWGDCRVIQR